MPSGLERISGRLYRYSDTCNVYVVVCPNGEAVLIDFGSGDVLDHLHGIGIERVGAVLMTHHHRDQGQGLPRAEAAGIPIWVPHTEQDLFRYAQEHWQAREVYNNYNVRQDRFSLLESVSIAGTLKDYSVFEFGGLRFEIVPAPGHTVGSIVLMTQLDGVAAAFTGDLICAPGKVWSLSAFQWGYNDMMGVHTTLLSLETLRGRNPELLLPSHGEPMDRPREAMDLLAERLQRFLKIRHGQREDFTKAALAAKAFEELTPHLLMNRQCGAYSYVLLSKSGKALFIDFGYDFPFTGSAAGTDRSSRRPLLFTPELLKQKYGVSKIDVVIPTHYHDDHVAGFNLLREVEGTQVWASENVADRLERPEELDLPCLWYDPIPVDRRLHLQTPIAWEEYELTLHELGGHTLYAVAVSFTVDGKKVAATGDQYGNDGHPWNYVYKNGFRAGDYRRSGELLHKLQPDLLLTGHWEPLRVTPGLTERLIEQGEQLERMHGELLPVDRLNYGVTGFCAELSPFQVTAYSGESFDVDVRLVNPDVRTAEMKVQLVFPASWAAEGPAGRITLAPGESGVLPLRVTPPAGMHGRKQRIAADISVGERKLGQQAEMLINILPKEGHHGS